MPLQGSDFVKHSRGYAADVSRLDIENMNNTITVHNFEGKDREFRLVKIHKHDEDIIGWQYEEVDGLIRLFIANE